MAYYSYNFSDTPAPKFMETFDNAIDALQKLHDSGTLQKAEVLVQDAGKGGDLGIPGLELSKMAFNDPETLRTNFDIASEVYRGRLSVLQDAEDTIKASRDQVDTIKSSLMHLLSPLYDIEVVTKYKLRNLTRSRGLAFLPDNVLSRVFGIFQACYPEDEHCRIAFRLSVVCQRFRTILLSESAADMWSTVILPSGISDPEALDICLQRCRDLGLHVGLGRDKRKQVQSGEAPILDLRSLLAAVCCESRRWLHFEFDNSQPDLPGGEARDLELFRDYLLHALPMELPRLRSITISNPLEEPTLDGLLKRIGDSAPNIHALTLKMNQPGSLVLPGTLRRLSIVVNKSTFAVGSLRWMVQSIPSLEDLLIDVRDADYVYHEHDGPIFSSSVRSLSILTKLSGSPEFVFSEIDMPSLEQIYVSICEESVQNRVDTRFTSMAIAQHLFRELFREKQFLQLRNLSIQLHVSLVDQEESSYKEFLTEYSTSYPGLEHIQLECSFGLKYLDLPRLHSFTLHKSKLAHIDWAAEYKEKLIAMGKWDAFDRLVLDNCSVSMEDAEFNQLAETYGKKLIIRN